MPLTKSVIGIVGPSGAGKSYALRNLNPAETVIIAPDAKGMPFRVPKEKWEGRYLPFTRAEDGLPAWEKALALKPKLICVDTFTQQIRYIQAACERDFKGYDIWKKYGERINEWMVRFNSANAIVIVTCQDEHVSVMNSDGSQSSRIRAFVDGNLVGKVGLETQMNACFHMTVKKKPDGSMEHQFETQTNGITTAKCPPFWGLPRVMDNDLNLLMLKLSQIEEQI